MYRYYIYTVILSLVLAAGPRADGGDLPPGQAVLRIRETQVTLRHGRVQGRATVIGKDQATLTVETAAHFLAQDDVGKTILVLRREGHLIGHIAAVTRNPDFHPIRLRNPDEAAIDGAVGVDSAIAVIVVDPRDRNEQRILETIKSADLALNLVPRVPRTILSVHIVDQFGEEHVFRAGNHLNPKCLAWGRRSYQPRPGDSGAGVFVMGKTAGGEPSPILIGNVAQADDRGGIASLAHRNAPWIEETLDRDQSPPGPLRRGAKDQPPAERHSVPSASGN